MRSSRHSKSRNDNKPVYDKKKELRSWILCLSIAIAVALVLRLFVFEFVLVKGDSMEPNLHTGEAVFVEKITKIVSGYDYDEILIVRYPNRTGAYVKRLIGMEGDVLEIKEGQLYRNGELIDEPFTREAVMFWDMPATTVPEDCVYVMGDNRNDSLDSRSADVGPIQENKIIGHALFVSWPLGGIRSVTDK